MNNLYKTVGLSMLATILIVTSVTTADWYTEYTPIDDVVITQPTAGEVFAVDSEYTLECEESYDIDCYYLNANQFIAEEDHVVHTWSAPGGTFIGGNTGTSVTWEPTVTATSRDITATASDDSYPCYYDSTNKSDTKTIVVKDGSTIVMAWTDESNLYHADYEGDLFIPHSESDWMVAVGNHERPVHGGCFVISNVSGTIWDVLPDPAEADGIEDYVDWLRTDKDMWIYYFGETRNDMPESAFREVFEGLNHVGEVPMEIILLVDNSGSTTYWDLEDGYDDFVEWLETTFPHANIGEVSMPSGNEYWIKYMAEALDAI